MISITCNIIIHDSLCTIYSVPQAKIQKHQAFEAEIQAHANTLEQLDQSGGAMIQENHYAHEIIKVTSQHHSCSICSNFTSS